MSFEKTFLPIYGLIGGLSQGNQINSQPNQSENSVSTNIVTSVSDVNVADSETSTTTPTVLGQLKIKSTIGDFANVRQAPFTQSTLVATAPANKQYFYNKISSNWYQIILSPTSSGWVFYKSIEKLK
jgi:hypothetical protein